MNIAIACDHGGLDLKKIIIPVLEDLSLTVSDFGCHTSESVDYPDFAQKVCLEIIEGRADLGILICGTGIGMSMAANRHKEIRAALCDTIFTARLSREHNNANVLCLGARVIGPGIACEIVKEWISTKFAGSRHLRRIEMF